MLTFTEAERAYLSNEIRIDGRGRRFLVGLTVEETAEFWAPVRKLAASERLSFHQDHRYDALARKLNAAASQSLDSDRG